MNILFDTLEPSSMSQEMRAAWEEAARASELSDPLSNELDWVLSYHAVHGRNRPVLLLFEHGNLVCLAEEHLPNGSVLLAPLEASWLYNRPLLGPDPLPLFFRAVDLIEQHYGRASFPTIILGGMWPNQALSNEILLNLGHVFSFFLYGEGTQASASLEGGIDGYLSRRSANFRAKLKKAVRRAKEAGIRYERVKPANLPDALATYERMLKVEKNSWKGKSENGLLHPLSTPFYRELLTSATLGGRARIIFARREEIDVGFIFGIVAHNIYRGQQFSYDLDLKALSLGNTLQYEELLWLTEEGVLRYDMGPASGEKMAYKLHWTELTFPLQSWILRYHAN